ncbi:hypothetical protein [Sphingomonas aurantiaca]|uniref:hypothetical protein n=1 Tax=Sphingomonas aurantiaca TaxID=185949 RepID=UPI00334E35C6
MNHVMWLLSRMRSTTVTERQPVHPPSAANISFLRTGVFAGEGTNQPDYAIPYLTVVPNCISLTSIHVLPLQGTAFLNAATFSENQAALVGHVDAPFLPMKVAAYGVSCSACRLRSSRRSKFSIA